MKLRARFKENGFCLFCSPIGDKGIYDGEEEIESEYSDCDKNHREPYLSEYKLKKIKDKIKEIITNYNYIPGLSVGYQQDDAWKSWIEAIITFSIDYEGVIITETEVTLPIDPLGNQETLDL